MLTDRDEFSNIYRGPSIDARCQVRFIWRSGFRGEDFLEIDQSETRIACGGHDCKRIGTKWAIFTEGVPRMLSTKFLFIWSSGVRGENFVRNQPIRNKDRLWRSCLITDRDEMSILSIRPSIDISYLASVHLAMRLLSRMFF